jgi:hypothetical protein
MSAQAQVSRDQLVSRRVSGRSDRKQAVARVAGYPHARATIGPATGQIINPAPIAYDAF